MELGKRIAEIRKEHDLTQEDLAEICCVTRQTISSWENGKSYLDLETLVLISDTFDVSLDSVLKGDRKMVSEITREQKKVRLGGYNIAVFIISIVIAALLLFILYVFTARTFRKENIISRSEGYVIMLSEQLLADAKKNNYTISKSEVIDSISLQAEPEWYQYRPEDLVFEVKLKGESQTRYYIYEAKVEARQDGKWFKEIKWNELPDRPGYSEAFRLAAIHAMAALFVIGLLIIRPVVKLFKIAKKARA